MSDNSNSRKMTLEERLVQRVKETELAALIDDEDAITELMRRALKEALFQPRRVPVGSYGEYKNIDSPLVEAARSLAKEAITALVVEEIDRIKADPKAMEAIRSAIVLFMPAVLLDAARELANTGAYAGALNAIEALKKAGLVSRDTVVPMPALPDALRGIR